MPTFPTKETEVTALAEDMIAGYTEHAGDFPSIDPLTDLPLLQSALATFNLSRTNQTDARSQAKQATVAKDNSLSSLVDIMKNDIKLSEVDTASDPTKLSEIGWGPRQQPMPVVAPGQPSSLDPVAEGDGTVWLKWKSPPAGSGGLVRNYVVERRQQPAGGGEFGVWEIVASVLNTEVNLADQPRGVQMEYRVKAANLGGESLASNTAPVVL